MAGERYLTGDHEAIRSWAEAREGRPSEVNGSGSDSHAAGDVADPAEWR